MKPKRDMTRKANLIISFLYGFTIIFTAIALLLHDNKFVYIAGFLVAWGILLALISDKKPIGWMGMTKERTN